MATLKEFEDALREHGMVNALAILEGLKKRDREKRSIAPARRVVGRKMTTELARTILEMHASTSLTQQEIAFKLGVNQGRVNEVIKRGKWLSGDPAASEALSRDKAMDRLAQRAKARRTPPSASPVSTVADPPSFQVKAADASTSASRETPVARREGSRRTNPAPTPAAAQVVEAELPFTAPAREGVPNSPTKPTLRRSSESGSAIVSAQLAFLDL